jgi:ABC-2 type transport system ATP-binding protein
LSDSIFHCKDLSKHYRKVQALKHMSFRLERGKIYGLIGNNGAGKTTLMRIIMGLAFPTAGSISLFGRREEREIVRSRRQIGALIERPVFHGFMTSEKNLEVLRILKGIPDKKAVPEALALLELTDAYPYRHFSYGMKQRLGLAAALLGMPDFLVLDEPINGLDPNGIRSIRELLVSLNRERGMTMLISSHYLEQLYHLATDFIIIHEGRLLEQISKQELAERCSRYISIVTDQPPAAVAVLEGICGEQELKVFPGNEIRLYSADLKPEALVKALTQNGVGIGQISSKGVSLEEYFAALVGGGKLA